MTTVVGAEQTTQAEPSILVASASTLTPTTQLTVLNHNTCVPHFHTLQRKTKRNTHMVSACQPKEKKTEKAAAVVAAPPVVRLPPALARGEVHVLEILYSTGSGVPPIRKQALDFGLGLDAAGQMEGSNITSTSGLSQADIRTFQTKLKVRHRAWYLRRGVLEL